MDPWHLVKHLMHHYTSLKNWNNYIDQQNWELHRTIIEKDDALDAHRAMTFILFILGIASNIIWFLVVVCL